MVTVDAACTVISLLRETSRASVAMKDANSMR